MKFSAGPAEGQLSFSPVVSPSVSVIITCYNYARFLGEAIESVLHQTYQPLEIIVVNDGSTDDTIGVCRQYPVTLVNQAHQGVAIARNRGVYLAKGDYGLFLDADDRLHPFFIQRTVNVLSETPGLALVYTHARLFGSQEGIVISREYDPFALMKGNYIFVTALFKRDVFELCGGFDPALPFLEDWDLWLAFAEKGYRGQLWPEPLFEWRRHDSSSRGSVRRSLARSKVIWQIQRKHWRLYHSWRLPAVLLSRQKDKLFRLGVEVLLKPVRYYDRTVYERWRLQALLRTTSTLIIIGQ